MAAGPFSAWERAIAFRYLRSKKSEGGVSLISIISFCGIAVAVFGLVATMSIMNGFRSDLLDRMLGFNGHMDIQGPVLTSPNRDEIIRRVRGIRDVTEVVSMVQSQALVQSPVGVAGAIVRGISREDLKGMTVISSTVTPGAFDRFGVGEAGQETVILGARLADALGVRVGDEISILSPSSGATVFGDLPTRKSYVVAGTFNVGMSELDQAFIFMPLAQAQLFFGRGEGVDIVEIKVREPDRAPDMKAAVARAAGPENIVLDWTQRNAAYFGALEVERVVMIIILSLVVAIAALNIISGVVMLVKNKGRDIGILRTMGAGRGAILRIFFMSGAMIGITGAVTGLLLGLLFCANIEAVQHFVEWITGHEVFNANVYFLAHIPAKVQLQDIVFVALWSMFSTFAATIIPAWRASGLDPVEALRYE